MKAAAVNNQSAYLDISEMLMKEPSPYLRPKILQHIEAMSPLRMTPELSPQIEGVFSFAMTPMMRKGTEIGSSVLSYPENQELQSFLLEDPEDERPELKHKKIRKDKNRGRPRLGSAWLPIVQDLELIEEENDRSESEDEEEESFIEEQSSEIQSISDEENNFHKYSEDEKQSTNFDLLSQEMISLEWQVANPRKELISRLKSVSISDQYPNDEQKVLKFKETIQSFIFDHEKFYFEETMNQLKGSAASILTTLTKGIEQTFKRNIRGLSFEKRRLKLLKYMEKKKKRVWRKKVNYDCRKKVADGRLRIKGKFVTFEQACEQLNMKSLEGYTADEVKAMLEKQS